MSIRTFWTPGERKRGHVHLGEAYRTFGNANADRWESGREKSMQSARNRGGRDRPHRPHSLHRRQNHVASTAWVSCGCGQSRDDADGRNRVPNATVRANSLKSGEGTAADGADASVPPYSAPASGMEHTYDAATNAMTAIDVKGTLQIAGLDVANGRIPGVQCIHPLILISCLGQ